MASPAMRSVVELADGQHLSPTSSARKESRRDEDAATILDARRAFEDEFGFVKPLEGVEDLEGFMRQLLDGSYLRDVAVAIARMTGAPIERKLYPLDGPRVHFENLT